MRETGFRRSPANEAVRFALGNWRISILALVPAAFLLDILHIHPIAIFLTAALALIPLSSLLGDATEELSAHVGPTAGGVINATLGNVTELVFGIVALWSGHTEVVKASITGSIIGNLLLVFGLAVLLGGLGREVMTFSRVAVGASTSMLFLAVVALVMPAVFQLTVWGSLRASGATIERLSVFTAAVLLASYFSSIVFMFRTHRNVLRGESLVSPTIRIKTAIILLVSGAALAAAMSKILVRQIEFVTSILGWTELFVGLVVVAVVGNAAEHSTAVLAARKGESDLALNIAVGSSTQIALLVAPLLVLISHARPSALSLVFHPMEIVAVISSVGLVAVVAMDGETNWFEGVQLLAVYVILAIFFYFLPAV